MNIFLIGYGSLICRPMNLINFLSLTSFTFNLSALNGVNSLKYSDRYNFTNPSRIE